MTTNTLPWPWPEDSREDRIKRVGRSYRDLILRITQGRCDDPAGDLHRLDMHWHSYGVHWPVPRTAPADPDDWVTAADAAMYADVAPGTVRKWAQRGLIRVDHRGDGTPIYNIGDLNDLARRRAKSRRASSTG
jgi:hypothetical protein